MTAPHIQTLSATENKRPAMNRLWWAALLAAVTTALANAVVYGIAELAGALPNNVLIDTPSGAEPLGLGAVIISSVVATIVAAIVFALLNRFRPNPVRAFRIVAAIILVISFAMPFSIPDAPLSMILTLEIMHVVAAVVIVSLLTELSMRERASAER